MRHLEVKNIAVETKFIVKWCHHQHDITLFTDMFFLYNMDLNLPFDEV